MDYNRVVEKWLMDYKEMTLKLNSLKVLYIEYELRVKNGDALAYDKDKLSKTNKLVSEVENHAIILAEMSINITHIENKILVINQGIKQLSEKERRILELRYMQNNRWDRALTWVQISRQMNYDVSWCRELRCRSVKTLAEVMFGVQC